LLLTLIVLYIHGVHISRVYGKGGVLVLCCMAISNVFPVLREDQQHLMGKSNFENYDTHFAPVVPRTQAPQEVNFDACQPGQTPMYHELVVFQQSQILPMFIVHCTERSCFQVPHPRAMQQPGRAEDNDHAFPTESDVL